MRHRRDWGLFCAYRRALPDMMLQEIGIWWHCWPNGVCCVAFVAYKLSHSNVRLISGHNDADRILAERNKAFMIMRTDALVHSMGSFERRHACNAFSVILSLL